MHPCNCKLYRFFIVLFSQVSDFYSQNFPPLMSQFLSRFPYYIFTRYPVIFFYNITQTSHLNKCLCTLKIQ